MNEDDDWFEDDGSTDESPDPDLERVFSDTSGDVPPAITEEEMFDEEAMERRLAREEASFSGVSQWGQVQIEHGILPSGRADGAHGCFTVDESGKRTPLSQAGTGYCPTCVQRITSGVMNS